MTTPTTSRVSDAQREAFEAWAVANGHPITIRDDGSDKYVSTLTNMRWSGWQAALASMGDVVAVSELDKLARKWDAKSSRDYGQKSSHAGDLRKLLTDHDDLSAVLNRGGK